MVHQYRLTYEGIFQCSDGEPAPARLEIKIMAKDAEQAVSLGRNIVSVLPKFTRADGATQQFDLLTVSKGN